MLKAHRLKGTYLLATVKVAASSQIANNEEQITIDSYAKSLEYNLLIFSPDGSCQRLKDGILQAGTYNLSQTNLRFLSNYYHDVKQDRQSISMTSIEQVSNKLISLRLRAYRLNLSTDVLRFSALTKATFIRQNRPETDEEIRTRVKNSLYFYSLFFRTIYTNQFNRFKPAAISLPIRYYNGGIRVPYKFDSTASWTKLYASNEDAIKALVYYKSAAKSVKRYPNGENKIHEYSLVLEQMAKALE